MMGRLAGLPLLETGLKQLFFPMRPLLLEYETHN